MTSNISVDNAISIYGARRGMAMLTFPLLLVPSLVAGIAIATSGLTHLDRVIGILFAAISSLAIIWFAWYAFGPKFSALRKQDQMVKTLTTEFCSTWFPITSQQWVTAPIVNPQGMASLKRCWYATVQLNGSEVAVMVEEERWNIHGRALLSSPTHIRFPDARYYDHNGELDLGMRYPNFALKSS